jgi:hypothetical protein
MPSKHRKARKSVDRIRPDEPIATTDEFPEVDLISLAEPDLVDLGDFNPVWEFLATHPPSAHPTPTSKNTILEHDPSRTQLRQKLATNQSVTFNVSPTCNITTNTTASITSQPQADCGQSKPYIPDLSTKNMPTSTYSNPEDDDEDDSSLYSSSYEDKRVSISTPRHKSFLYIPPTFSSPLKPLKPSPVAPATPSAADRRRTLIEKLISKYPEEVNQIIPSQLPSPALSTFVAPKSPDLHIFVDNSNILIGFFDTYKTTRNISDPFVRNPKFDFHNFSTIVERGRPVARKILVGSNPLVQPVALAQHLGYEISILERVVDTTKRTPSDSPYSSDSATRTPREKKKEQAVDEVLHLKILECLLDVEKPATIVLATGDAAPAEFSREGGFLKCIQRALNRGWHVELVTWRKSMSRLWRDRVFRIQWRDTFSVVELDNYADELVLE